MSFRNNLFTALRGITSNTFRSILTTLGIVIGVASVISMLALGSGARAAVDANFRWLGSDQVEISERQELEDGVMQQVGMPLTYADGLELIEKAPLVRRVEMSVNGPAKIRYSRVVIDMKFSGITESGLNTIIASDSVLPVGWPEGQAMDQSAYLSEGSFFTAAEVLESADVCVLGYQTAQSLFMGEPAVGKTVWVNRHACEVVGVLAELESVKAQTNSLDYINNVFYLPVSTAIDHLFEKPPSVFITAFVKDESQMEDAKMQIVEFLRKKHGILAENDGSYKDDFTLTTRKDVLGMQQAAARTFSTLLAAMAVVSLIVGGIGIMNVMLVSVTERTREIGVRLAVGAQKGDIIRQFLTEAVLISAGGGMIGIFLGIMTIPIAASLNQGIALLDPGSIPLSFGVALLTGVAFGLYPAYRASRLDPIEALRYE